MTTGQLYIVMKYEEHLSSIYFGNCNILTIYIIQFVHVSTVRFDKVSKINVNKIQYIYKYQ